MFIIIVWVVDHMNIVRGGAVLVGLLAIVWRLSAFGRSFREGPEWCLSINNRTDPHIGLSDDDRKWFMRDNITIRTEEQCAVLSFLQVKKVFRELVFPGFYYRKLINPIGNDAAHLETGFQFVVSLISQKGEISLDYVPNEVTAFDQAMEQLDGWNDSATSYIFFRDDPDLANKGDVRIQRVQEGTFSYMHAAVTLQYYLIAKYSNPNQTLEILDIPKYIREKYRPLQFKYHIFGGAGSCRGLMLDILQTNSTLRAHFSENIDRDFLKKYGPGLVTRFEVHSDFFSTDKLVFTGNPSGQKLGLHAMLVIGVRMVGESRRFLLQNWWKRQQFIEVGFDYMISCNPRIAFVLTPQTSVPPGFSRAVSKYAETINIDRQDMHYP